MNIVADVVEECREPDHLFHIRQGSKNTDANPFVMPVTKRPKETAGNIFDVTHVDPHRSAFFHFHQPTECLPDQRQIFAVPDLHVSDVDNTEFPV